MGRIVQDEDKFEIWDGGHCYIRAKRSVDNFISLHRFPPRASPKDLAKLAEWAVKIKAS